MSTAPSINLKPNVRLSQIPAQRHRTGAGKLLRQAIGFPEVPVFAEGRTVGVFFDLDSELSRDQLHPAALDLLNAHRSAGHRIWLVTSQPSGTAELLTRRLGAAGWVSAEPHHGRGKAERIEHLARQEGIDLSISYAYADSLYGLPLLEAVGHPGVVNPDPALHRISAIRRWRRHTFRPWQAFAARLGWIVVVGTSIWLAARLLNSHPGRIVRGA